MAQAALAEMLLNMRCACRLSADSSYSLPCHAFPQPASRTWKMLIPLVLMQAEGSQRTSAVEVARWRAAADAAADLVRKADARAEAAQNSAREAELASAQVCAALRSRVSCRDDLVPAPLKAALDRFIYFAGSRASKNVATQLLEIAAGIVQRPSWPCHMASC